MDGQSALDQLAAAAGIEPEFHDEWGNPRAAPATTKIALLEAMGLPAGTEDHARDSLARLEEAPWRRALPPAAVWDGCGEPSVSIIVPEAEAGRTLLCSLETESGEAVQTETRADALSVTDRRTVDGKGLERRTLPLPSPPPLGYHRLRLYFADEAHDTTFIAVPRQCHLPETLRGDGRGWGFSVQLYGLRSSNNWGMGDFTDLERLARLSGSLGADAIGLNPLHALFPGNPGHASPYSPSSRLFLNVLYIDVTSVAELGESEAARELIGAEPFAARLEALRDEPIVDYAAVAEVKLQALELLYKAFAARHLGTAAETAETERGAAFRRFQAAGGSALERHATFEALAEHFDGKPWRDWPAAYRDPASDTVAAFARERRDRVEYFEYLQWLGDQQLHRAAHQANEQGMSVGLYHDLALAGDANGADAWCQQDLLVDGVAIGAPPDAWNHRGQNWGAPPVNPLTLREHGFAPFAAVLAANMRHGGALRLDHAMSLQRLYWIPDGAEPTEGAYVHQPFEELLGILALESQRQQCMVIGEDLGTLPPNFSQRMHAAGVLSYRLLYFQTDERGRIMRPEDYPELSAVVVGTHDLAPLPGFWAERDLDLRAEIGLYPSRTMEQEARTEREEFCRRLVAALKHEGLLPQDSPEAPEMSDGLVMAVYHHLARSPGRLLLVQPEDVLGVTEQSNLPGTVHENPNWRRKLPLTLERLADDPRMLKLADMLRVVRPGSGAGRADAGNGN